METIKIIIDFLDKVTIIFATITMFGVLYGIWQRKKEKDKIKIIFDVEGVDYLLDLDMPRKHISRSEVQGILAAFQMDIKARYSIDYLSDLSFLYDIFKIQQNELQELRIKLSAQECLQFNIKKMKQL